MSVGLARRAPAAATKTPPTHYNMPQANPFAALIDPASVLAACEASVTLRALPVVASNRSDRRASWLAADVARFDTLVDAMCELEMQASLDRASRRRPHRKAQCP
jgi:hypothetical protein